MTHHTDAEQLHQLLELVLTELDRKAIPIAYMQEIDRKGKAFIEQAARRAPAAPLPLGWKLVPEWPTVEMSVAGDDVYREDGPDVFSSNTIYTRMLAAAPRLPVAAPVELPEPAEFQVRIRPTWDANHHCTSWEKCTPEAAADYERTPLLHDWAYEVRKLYTEQQVRDLLAAHGITKGKK